MHDQHSQSRGYRNRRLWIRRRWLRIFTNRERDLSSLRVRSLLVEVHDHHFTSDRKHSLWRPRDGQLASQLRRFDVGGILPEVEEPARFRLDSEREGIDHKKV